MADANRYPVGTVFEMAAIPAEARQRFLAEFPEMLATIDAIRTAQGLFEGIAEVEFQTPTWIDDGEGMKTITLIGPDGIGFSHTDKIKGE